MRLQGRLHDWNDDRAFGFVTPNGGGARAFVHIRAFARGVRRPANGDALTYAAVRDAQGRLRAEDVRFADARMRTDAGPRSRAPRRSHAGWFVGGCVGGLLAGFALALAAAIASGRLPVAAAAIYAGTSLIALATYARDKRAAEARRWRTPESTLHLLALLGGWPGALLAQRWLRHKTGKTSFQIAFWATVAVNVAALYGYADNANGAASSLLRALHR